MHTAKEAEGAAALLQSYEEGQPFIENFPHYVQRVRCPARATPISQSDDDPIAANLLANLRHMKYKPLDFLIRETRFIRLQPSSGNDPLISCTLETASLASPPNFTALSYCWGNPAITKQIKVDGVLHNVTVSLEQALRALQTNHEQLVWADALCINQQDAWEKICQISQMAQVYARASKVFAWLGPASKNSDEGMQLMAGKRMPGRNTYQALEEVFSRDYWRRVWIIQEIAKGSAGSRIEVWCGSEFFDWQSWPESHPIFKLPERLRRPLTNIDKFCQQESHIHLGQTRVPLAHALFFTYHAEATNPLDKVFAILALTSDGGDIVPLPTYKQEPVDLFRQIAEYMIVTQGRTSLLLLASSRFRTPRDELGRDGLKSPSWVPQLKEPKIHVPDWIIAASTKDTKPRQLKARCVGRALELRALCVNIIALDPTEGMIKPSNIKRIDTTHHLLEIWSTLTMDCHQPATVDDEIKIMSVHFGLKIGVRKYVDDEMNERRARAIATLSETEQLSVWFRDHCDWYMGPFTLGELCTEHRRRCEKKKWFGKAPTFEFSREHAIIARALARIQRYRLKLVTTRDRILRLVSEDAQGGDYIFWIENCPAPLVFRRTVGLSRKFTLVGDMFLHLNIYPFEPDGDLHPSFKKYVSGTYWEPIIIV